MTRIPLLLAAGLLVGCNSVSSPDVIVDPIDVDRVEVRVGAARPAQVAALVEGRVGDGCTKVLPVEQSRSGSTVTLQIKRTRPVAAICTQQLLLFNEVIALTGDFPAGDYRLLVNAREFPFRVN